jgi:hypothetical protein
MATPARLRPTAPIGRGNCPFRYVVDGTRIGEDSFEIDDIRRTRSRRSRSTAVP